MLFSNAIVLFRAQNHLTQKEFADKLSVSKRTVILWEQGEIVPRKTKMVEIANLFGMKYEDFINEIDISDSMKKHDNTNTKQKTDASAMNDIVINPDQFMDEMKKILITEGYSEETSDKCCKTCLNILSNQQNNTIK